MNKYYFSKLHGMRFKFINNDIMFEDRTMYKKSEIDILKEAELLPAEKVTIHKIKNMFDGVIK